MPGVGRRNVRGALFWRSTAQGDPMDWRWLLGLFLLPALALLQRLGRRDTRYRRRSHPRDASSGVSSFDHGLLLQSKKPPGGLVARMARQGIAGVVLELLQYLSWREGTLGAPAIGEDLFAQLPAVFGVYERVGRCMLAGRSCCSERLRQRRCAP
jgi:hypothetical protein